MDFQVKVLAPDVVLATYRTVKTNESTEEMRNSLGHLLVELAVVVQAMMQRLRASCFTANPVNQSKEELLISAGYGLGETVVR